MAWKSDPVVVEVEEPVPGPGQVVVRVAAAGACHSDLHIMRDTEPGRLPWSPPFTLGHENVPGMR
jgi:propanol-preferring alcohol dehydrogenase